MAAGRLRLLGFGAGGLGVVLVIALFAPALFGPATPRGQDMATSVAQKVIPTSTPKRSAAKPSGTSPTPSPVQTPPREKIVVQARVLRVIDGETLEVESEGKVSQVRLLGVDAPDALMCFSSEASEYARAQVERSKKVVWLEQDVSDEDGSGRLLRYVWLDSPQSKEMLNEALVSGGYARVSITLPDTRYEDRFLTIEHAARTEKRGLWGACGGSGVLNPTPTEPATPDASPSVPTPTKEPAPTLIVPTSTPGRSPTSKVAFASPTKRPTRTPLPTSKPSHSATTTPSPHRSSTPTTLPTVHVEAFPTMTHPMTTPTATAAPQEATAEPTPTALTGPVATATTGLRYDPNGPDRDCADFDTQAEAQAFFIAAGGPERDPHDLDRDHDGVACEALP